MKSKRFQKGAKRADTRAVREWVGNQQLTTALGVVRKFPGESSHFEIDTENGTNEILVDVELVPSGTRVQCRLGFGNDGVYRIPRENSEVAVLLPFDPSSLIKDPMDFEPIIVGVLNVNAPSQLSTDDTIVIEAAKVHILSNNILCGDTANDPVARKSDVESVRSDLDSHIDDYNGHAHTGVTTGTGTSAVTTIASSSSSTPAYSSNTKVK